MESFKINHFEREHPNLRFPEFSTLSPAEAKQWQLCLQSRLGLSEGASNLELVTRLFSVESLYNLVNAEDEGFNLEHVINSIGLVPQRSVYINWYGFDQIDKIEFSDLVSHFNDIWYPSSDDIDIFDSTMSWVISICHEGDVRFLKLNGT